MLPVDEILARALTHTDTLEQLPGWCTALKGKRLADMAAALPQGAKCVELGVYGGRSLIALAAGLQSVRGAYIWGFDAYEGEKNYIGFDAAWTEIVRKGYAGADWEALYVGVANAIVRYDLSRVASIVKMDVRAASRGFENDVLDLMHLDATHSESESCADVLAWLPKMKAQSTWIFDDSNWPTMQKAQELLMSAGYKSMGAEPEGYWMVYQR